MILASVAYVLCGVAGAFAGGALGTMWGSAVAAWIGSLLFWWELRGALRDSRKFPAGNPSRLAYQRGRHRRLHDSPVRRAVSRARGPDSLPESSEGTSSPDQSVSRSRSQAGPH
jgi:hypothetical protein